MYGFSGIEIILLQKTVFTGIRQERSQLCQINQQQVNSFSQTCSTQSFTEAIGGKKPIVSQQLQDIFVINTDSYNNKDILYSYCDITIASQLVIDCNNVCCIIVYMCIVLCYSYVEKQLFLAKHRRIINKSNQKLI